MKIKKIEKLNVIEDAYDVSVASQNHNFELSNGVFVHNSLKVLKQFFGFTEDGAGFNGGTSLTILSSRYGKTIKKIQGILCQMVTDILNLFLIDRGLNNYVNKFRVRMQTPVTQEELDRRTNTDTRVRYVGDIMQQLNDVEDKVTKLKIYKALLTGVVNDNEIVSLIQNYINKLEDEENKAKEAKEEKSDNITEPSLFTPTEEPNQPNQEEIPSEELPSMEEIEANEEIEDEEEKDILNEDGTSDEFDSYMPSPEELGFDAVNNVKIEKEDK